MSSHLHFVCPLLKRATKGNTRFHSHYFHLPSLYSRFCTNDGWTTERCLFAFISPLLTFSFSFIITFPYSRSCTNDEWTTDELNNLLSLESRPREVFTKMGEWPKDQILIRFAISKIYLDNEDWEYVAQRNVTLFCVVFYCFSFVEGGSATPCDAISCCAL